MSDKQEKETLLVDQNEALGFYFDSLLSPEETEVIPDPSPEPEPQSIDPKPSARKEPSAREKPSANKEPSPERELDRAREFLQASKLRQNKQPDSHPGILKKTNEGLTEDSVSVSSTSSTVNVKLADTQASSDSLTLQNRIESDVITPGPVSPKPRIRESSENRSMNSAATQTATKAFSQPTIVFSETDKDGNIKEQVLVPRSQRLSQSGINKPEPAKSVQASRPDVTTHKIKEPEKNTTINEQALKAQSPEQQATAGISSTAPIASAADEVKKTDLQTQKTSVKEDTTAIPKEAPKLDLSLFLPKIKTLSDEEIAQQIEALTQAAVSQAQLDSDLAQAARLEQLSSRNKLAQKQNEELVRNIDNAPDWAIPEFQALLFAVAGLKLAVPLSELNGILSWGEDYITEMPDHAPWYLGIIRNQGKNIPVIDTMQQVVPKNRWPANHLQEKNFKHIILINNSHWGLACERVLEVITLNTEAVKWRSSRTKRRWLLGTVIDHMCALLDSTEFAAMLETGEDTLE
jgi:chemotaxis signal transduction protein